MLPTCLLQYETLLVLQFISASLLKLKPSNRSPYVSIISWYGDLLGPRLSRFLLPNVVLLSQGGALSLTSLFVSKVVRCMYSRNCT
ncbi:hypothetical protein GGR56DRAFT_648758 [Xylariaceae sp. FL0804]|nr:hypothetical protein GGR56DRAFT_648758 [Xylariaceae sp. FL0804]